MSMMVYKQTVAGQCGNYAYLVALQHKGIQITEEEIIKLPNFLTHGRAKQFLSPWKIETADCITTTIAKNFLKKGYLVTYTANGDFAKAGKPPFILGFQDKKFSHFFVIKSFDYGKGLFVCQNSWGSTWGMGGDFYLKEQDFKRLFDVKRIIT